MLKWKTIEEFPQSQVSSAGQVKGPRGLRKATIMPKGYLVINFNGSGRKTISRLVHRLVLQAFVGECPKGHECRHLDGDPSNNNLDNLCWGTYRENAADKLRHGTNNSGERNGKARLKADKVLEIREFAKSEPSPVKVARHFGITEDNAWQIIHRVKWKHLK